MSDQIHEAVPRIGSDDESQSEERGGTETDEEEGGSGGKRLLLLAVVALAVVGVALFFAWRRNAPISRRYREVQKRSTDVGGERAGE